VEVDKGFGFASERSNQSSQLKQKEESF